MDTPNPKSPSDREWGFFIQSQIKKSSGLRNPGDGDLGFFRPKNSQKIPNPRDGDLGFFRLADWGFLSSEIGDFRESGDVYLRGLGIFTNLGIFIPGFRNFFQFQGFLSPGIRNFFQIWGFLSRGSGTFILPSVL